MRQVVARRGLPPSRQTLRRLTTFTAHWIRQGQLIKQVEANPRPIAMRRMLRAGPRGPTL